MTPTQDAGARMVSATYSGPDKLCWNEPDKNVVVWFEAPPRSIFLEDPRKMGRMQRVRAFGRLDVSYELHPEVVAFLREHRIPHRRVCVASRTPGWEGEPGYFIVFEHERDLILFGLKWGHLCGARTA